MARLLLVDDEPMNLELLHTFLAATGHELVDAESGEDALRLAGDALPDLALLDVHLRGMNGFEVAQRLRALAGGARLPIVMMCALHDHPAEARSGPVVADAFLPKPFERKQLRDLITSLL